MSNNWKGKIMIVKDNRCIMILPEELEKYKEEGWKRGSRRKPMSKKHRENISKNTVKAMQNPEILKKLKDSFKARVLDIISNIKGGDDFNE